MGSTNRFIDYYSKPLNQDQLNYLNKLNDVTIEKVELFRDFTLSLFYTVYQTYLGDDVINNDEDMVIHFNWCWNKVIDDYSMENLFFVEKGEHYYYFLNYFTDKFYILENKDTIDLNEIVQYWSNIFSIDQIKTKSQYDIFIELYKIQNNYFLNND
jgi:hypothetical protein